MTNKPHVLIIGAGITGLIVAHGLKRAGISFDIFEAEDASVSRRREWTMGVHWGVPLMEELIPEELTERLIPEACVDKTLDYVTPPTNGSRIWDGVTGKLLKEISVPGRLLRVSRRKLRRLLGEGLDIKFGHKLTGVEYSEDGQTVTARFANDTQYTGTVLVGADGPRSSVRDHLFGPEVAKAKGMDGVVNMTTTVCYHDAEVSRLVRTAHPVWSMQVHPDLFSYVCIQDVPDEDKPEDWTYMVFCIWRGEKDLSLSDAERLALLKSKAANIHEPFRTAILGIPDDVVMPYADIGYWFSQKWDTHNGRTILAGDAVHPMPPYRGQGLNNAIQDAHNFVRDMVKLRDSPELSRKELMDAYTAEVVARGAEEIQLSVTNGLMLLDYDNLKDSPYMKMGLSRVTATTQNEGSATAQA